MSAAFISLDLSKSVFRVHEALVQQLQCGRRGPIRSGQLGNADEVRASGLDHSVEDSNADGSLGLLAGQLSGMQMVIEDALVACRSGFRLGSLAVRSRFPAARPAQVPLVGKGLDRLIALRRFSG
jgi:hypothetical protein